MPDSKDKLRVEVEQTRAGLYKAIREQVGARVRQEEEALGPDPETDDSLEARAPSYFVRSCVLANELGDGLLYAALQRDRYFFEPNSQVWYRWTGHHYRPCEHGEHLAAMESVVERLFLEIRKLEAEIGHAVQSDDTDSQKQLERLRKEMIKRVKKLRTERGRKAALHFSVSCEDPLSISSDELDKQTYLKGCPSGVIDLRSGKFRDGRPEDRITKGLTVDLNDFHEFSELWDQVLKSTFGDDLELVDFFQRLMGYILLGNPLEHVIVFAHGKGRNGKTLIFSKIMKILGPLGGAIQSEMLMATRQPKNSAGPSPDILGLKGLLLALASEVDDNRSWSAARLKWLSGQDQLVARGAYHQHETRFDATHVLVILSNNKPQAPADDFAFWERVLLIPFKYSFVNRDPVADDERVADKNLSKRLDEELSGILAWMLRGAMAYQREGLNPPESVRVATREYRRENDLLADFLDAHCLVSEHQEEHAKDLYERFSSWYELEISSKGISNTRFGRILTKRFEKVKRRGRFVYLGLALRPLCPKCEVRAVGVEESTGKNQMLCPECQA